MVALAARPPLAVAAVIVGVFAIFHGHAHGTELPQSASPIAYSLGFVIATGLLHAVGIAFSLLSRWPAGPAPGARRGRCHRRAGCLVPGARAVVKRSGNGSGLAALLLGRPRARQRPMRRSPASACS
jgi:hypothetical protein